MQETHTFPESCRPQLYHLSIFHFSHLIHAYDTSHTKCLIRWMIAFARFRSGESSDVSYSVEVGFWLISPSILGIIVYKYSISRCKQYKVVPPSYRWIIIIINERVRKKSPTKTSS